MAAKYGKQKWTKGAQIDAPREKLPMLDWQWRDARGGGRGEPYLTLTVCGVNREERERERKRRRLFLLLLLEICQCAKFFV